MQHSATNAPRLTIIAPCFDEEAVLATSARILLEKLQHLVTQKMAAQNSFLLLVDDGSTDATWSIIEQLHDETPDNRLRAIKLAGNRGQQNALLAGLMEARAQRCECAITIDVDLQDDIDAIDSMLIEYLKGAEIVVGIRSNRDSDTTAKRLSAHLFYRMASALGVGSINDAADFRLLSLKALDALAEYPESNLFLRGIVPSMGLKTTEVHYQRRARTAGKSKYSVKKMAGLALDGITSFSIAPMRIASLAGVLCLVVSLLMIVHALASRISGNAVPGWTSLMISLWFIGGLVTMSVGILGEYLGRTYLETKRRPRFLVERTLGHEQADYRSASLEHTNPKQG